MRLAVSLPKFSMPTLPLSRKAPRSLASRAQLPSLPALPAMPTLPAIPTVTALSNEAVERAQAVAAEIIDVARATAHLEAVKEVIETLQPQRKRARGRRIAVTAVAVTATAAMATAAYVLWKRHDHFEADAPVFTSNGGAAAAVAEREVEASPAGPVVPTEEFMTEAPPHMTTEPGVTIQYTPSAPPAPMAAETPPASAGTPEVPQPSATPPNASSALPPSSPMASAQPIEAPRTPGAPHPSGGAAASMYRSTPPPSARASFEVPTARTTLPSWGMRLP